MMSGIRMIRDIVTTFGVLKKTTLGARRGAVQVLVDALGERPADSFDLGDVVQRRRLELAHSAKGGKQRLPALGADARDLLQRRAGARLAAARAMADDGEAVRLVADLLDEVQARMGRRKLERAALLFQDQLLLAWLSFRSLRHADH